MTPTFKAQCYLAAWDAGQPIQGGLAHAERLRDFQLDYSWGSLARIDAFLDELRERLAPQASGFLDEQANTSLLYLLAFYVGEVRARVVGMPAQWASWQELLETHPSSQMFGEGFHSSIAQVAPGRFLPLVSITHRLFEGDGQKSVQFSAGFEIESKPGLPPAEQPLPPVLAQSLVADFPALYARLPAAARADYVYPDWPQWLAHDQLDRLRTDTSTLLRTGRMVWGRIVQANRQLFEGGIAGAPLELLYDPRGQVSPQDLGVVANALFGLRGERPDEPALQVYAEHLRAERSRLFGWRTPSQGWWPYPLSASSSFVHTAQLPGGRLAFAEFPVLISDACPGSVMVAPWQCWPAPVFDAWAEAVRADNPNLAPQPALAPTG